MSQFDTASKSCVTCAALLVLAGASHARADVPAGKDVRHFDVNEYRVEGNTVLTETEIDRAVYGFLGPDRSLDDIDHARAALAEAYAKHGYATVSTELPQQRVANGVVVIRVTERPVGRLRVTGSRYFALDQIKRHAKSLREGTVPDMGAVQRDIVGLNQWPDRTVTPVLRAGALPGTVDVDLQVQDKLPLHASLELNNEQSIDTSPLRLAGNVTYDNLWQRGDSATVDFQLAPENPNDATVISGSYLFRIPDSPLSILASYLHSNSNVSTVGNTDVVGRGDVAGVRLLIPLAAGEGFVHSLSAGFDYKHFGETIILGTDQSAAPVTYWPATVSYQAAWTTPQSETDLSASVLWTFSGIGSRDDQFFYRRYDALSGFIVARADLERTQKLPYGMQLYAHALGEVAPEPVVDNEQFTLGGLNSVRGYLEAETLGDEGAAIQTELRSPALTPPLLAREVDELRFLAFFDVGGAAIHNPLATPVPQTQSYTLASTGGGVRIRLFTHLNAEFLAAVALDRGLQTRPGEARGLFRVYGDF